jgi:hypothetical protein
MLLPIASEAQYGGEPERRPLRLPSRKLPPRLVAIDVVDQ